MVMTRRDVLRSVALTAVASPLLAGCGERAGGVPGAVAVPEVDLVASDLGRSAGAPDAVGEVVAALQSLAGGLYGSLAAEPGNLVLSPYSVAVALAMTLPGAGGRTASEMRDVLGVTEDARFHGGLNALSAHVDSLAGPVERADGSTAELALAGANQLYGQHDVGWEEEFLDLLAAEYGAGLRSVDLGGDPEQARVLINDWVAGRTQDRVPELVPAGVIDADTCLVLVNALYLKAPWETPFDKVLTGPAPFHRRRRQHRRRRHDGPAGPGDHGGRGRGLAGRAAAVRRWDAGHDPGAAGPG